MAEPTGEIHMMILTESAFAELARAAARRGMRVDDAFAAALREWCERSKDPDERPVVEKT